MSFFINKVVSYFIFLRFYLIATFFSVIVDLVAYTYLRNHINIIASALISFIFGQITVFSILNVLQVRKNKKEKICFYNSVFDRPRNSIYSYPRVKISGFKYLSIKLFSIQNIIEDKNLYNLITKFIAACIGFFLDKFNDEKIYF